MKGTSFLGRSSPATYAVLSQLGTEQCGWALRFCPDLTVCDSTHIVIQFASYYLNRLVSYLELEKAAVLNSFQH